MYIRLCFALFTPGGTVKGASKINYCQIGKFKLNTTQLTTAKLCIAVLGHASSLLGGQASKFDEFTPLGYLAHSVLHTLSLSLDLSPVLYYQNRVMVYSGTELNLTISISQCSDHVV